MRLAVTTLELMVLGWSGEPWLIRVYCVAIVADVLYYDLDVSI